jgi:hypothetical protein
MSPEKTPGNQDRDANEKDENTVLRKLQRRDPRQRKSAD